MLRPLPTCVLLLAWLAAAACLAAEPAGRVLELQGKVTATSAAGKERQLDTLDTVYVGDKLAVSAGARLVLAFRGDGHVERAKAGGQLTVGKEGCEPKAAVEAVEMPEGQRRLVIGTVKQLRPKGLGGATIMRGGAPPEGALTPPQISPIDGATVVAARPVFRWPPLRNADRYEVHLSKEGKESWTGSTAETRLEYAGKDALLAGADYEWQVLAIAANRQPRYAWGGMFTPATAEQKQRADELLKLAAGRDTVMLALAAAWFEEQNFYAEATAAYERLVERQPNVAAYYFALGRLYSRAERGEDSQRAIEKARRLRPPPANPPAPEWEDDDA